MTCLLGIFIHIHVDHPNKPKKRKGTTIYEPLIAILIHSEPKHLRKCSWLFCGSADSALKPINLIKISKATNEYKYGTWSSSGKLLWVFESGLIPKLGHDLYVSHIDDKQITVLPSAATDTPIYLHDQSGMRNSCETK